MTLIPVLGVFLANTNVVAQGSVADLLSADSHLNLLSNGGLEVMKPAYWESTGDGAIWNFEESRTPETSLELSGAGAASWMQSEAIRNWVPAHPADENENPELVVGAWVKTMGVNTAPATDDDKFQLVFNWYTDATQSENVFG